MKPLDLPKWDFPAIIRLIAVLGSVGLYLSVTQWTEHLDLSLILILIGCLIGSWVGISRFTDLESTGIGFVLGTSLIFYYLSSVIPYKFISLDRTFRVMLNLNQSIIELLHNQPVSNSILFLAGILIVCWNLGFFAGFGLIRKTQPWVPVFLAGIGIVVIDLYVPISHRSGIFTGLFFFFLLFLISRVFFTREKNKWQRQNIRFDAEAKFDLNWVFVLSCLIITIIAWTIPFTIKAFTPGTVEQFRFQRYVENMTQPWNNLFAPLNRGENQSVFSYGNSLSIGESIPISEKTIFTVETSVAPPAGIHIYWRARSYDIYDGSEWFNVGGSLSNFSEENQLSANPEGGDPYAIRFSYQMDENVGIFFLGGITGKINQPGQEISYPTEDSARDVIAVIPNHAMEKGAMYQTDGWVLSPTISAMKSLSDSYPSWIVDKYLSLPTSLPKRVIALAETLTANMDNPYSKAQIITNFLRNNMHYASGVSSVPGGKDLVDWFLFDTKQGFCLHYASAEVILLRAVGIPARLVVGYAEGIKSQDGKQYTVRLVDSHAWPEVYFTNIGWVIFEPTSIIQQQIFEAGLNNQMENQTAQPTNLNPIPTESEITSPISPNPIADFIAPTSFVEWLLLGIAVLAIIFGVMLFNRWQRKIGIYSFPAFLRLLIQRTGRKPPVWIVEWEQTSRISLIKKQFQVVQKGIDKFDIPCFIADTPAEQVQKLVNEIPQVKSAAKALLTEYEKEIFGEKQADLRKSTTAAAQIRSALFRETFKRFLKD